MIRAIGLSENSGTEKRKISGEKKKESVEISEKKKKRTGQRLKLILAAFLVCLLCGAAHSQAIKGRVVAIADGDTLTVLDGQNQQHKIRLNGIDAPESGQEFGQASKRNLSELVFGKDVAVFGSKIDKYERRVGTVLIGSTNANLEQLKAGLAWFYRQYAGDVPEIERTQYEAAEAEARAEKRGLWQQPKPVPPWEFRHPEQAEPIASASVASPGAATTTGQRTTGRIIGNRNSGIYHLPNCPDYSRIAERNREYFDTEADAMKAGFRKARNCP